MAGREKDRKYCRALLQREVVKPDVLTARLDSVLALDPQVANAARVWIEAWIGA